MSNVRTAIVPAAGWGTRLLPATKAVPKELLPVLDRPVIQYVVDEAAASGIERLVVITRHDKPALRRYLTDDAALTAFLESAGQHRAIEQTRALLADLRIDFIEQAEQRGLGHAVLCGADAVAGEPFAVLLGDTIIQPDDGAPAGLAQCLDVFNAHGGSVVSVRRVRRDAVSRYGIVDGAELADDERIWRLNRLVEKPAPEKAPTDLAIAGRYVFTPRIMELLADQPPGRGGEVQLTDAMNRLAQEQAMFALRWRATRYDIGNVADYARCFAELAIVDNRTRSALEEAMKTRPSSDS